MADTDAQLLTKLRDAKTKLITGTLPSAFVDQNGEKVEYSKADLPALNAEIRRLEAYLEPTSKTRPRTRSIKFIFGR